LQIVEKEKGFEKRCMMVKDYVQLYHDAGITLGRTENFRKESEEDYEGPLNFGVSYSG
jgi:hypothetical protein